MPISLTCSCGAVLEIDDAFAGKTIPCPDCQKPLSTAPPLPQPDRPVSMLAVSSLIAALTLGFIPLGGLVAAALGFVALRRIDASADALAGRTLAKGGTILGLSAAIVTGLLVFFGPILHLDGFVRGIEFTGLLDCSKTKYEKPIGESVRVAINKPGDGWGRVPLKEVNALHPDHILLYSPFQDAFLTVLSETVGRDAAKDDTDKLAAALKGVEKSDMIRCLLGAPPGKEIKDKVPAFKEEPVVEDRGVEDEWGQYVFRTRLGGKKLLILVRYKMRLGDDTIFVLAAAFPERQASSVQPDIEAAMKSFEKN